MMDYSLKHTIKIYLIINKEMDTDYEKVLLLNTVYNNTLLPTNIIQSPLIKTQLMSHQATMVHGMQLYKDKMVRGFLVGNRAINGKIGIIGDPSGSGKTLSILSYLASYANTFPRITSELTPYSSKYFFSHDINELSDASSTNLIIVPHHLFGQWRDEIEKHTIMEYTHIETKRMIKGDDLSKRMVTSHFVLTTNKCYKFVQAYANQHKIQWNNIFIDEASSIYLQSSDPVLNFQFLWLITNNWIPLLFKSPVINKSNLLFLRDKVALHSDLENWLLDNITHHYQGELLSSFLKEYLSFLHENRGYIVLRNLTNTIQSSITVPDNINDIIQCRPHITLQSLSSAYLSKNMKMSFRSEKIPHLFQSLGISCKDITDYLPLQISAKHTLINKKKEENECIICFEECEYPTIVNCCYNIYCGKCLLKNTILTYKCPTCRDKIDVDNLCCLIPLTDETRILVKNKSDACIDIIKKYNNAKIIIYSAFDNIYYQLFEEINKLGIKADRLENNIYSMLKTIKNFKDGDTTILFISNITILRGLSLPFTSHIIFYHDVPSFELKEVLIHSAQRIGRTQPLSIIHLNSEIQF